MRNEISRGIDVPSFEAHVAQQPSIHPSEGKPVVPVGGWIPTTGWVPQRVDPRVTEVVVSANQSHQARGDRHELTYDVGVYGTACPTVCSAPSYPFPERRSGASLRFGPRNVWPGAIGDFVPRPTSEK